MFLSSYEAIREKILQDRTIQTMAHLGARAFPEISGEVVQTTAFVMQGKHLNGFKPVFFRLVDTEQDQKDTELKAGLNRFDSTIQDDFKKIPGSPVAYWLSNNSFKVFEKSETIQNVAEPRQGMATSDVNRFIRFWHEVSYKNIKLDSSDNNEAKKSTCKWFPHNKGGEFRRWYGNNLHVVNWYNGGEEVLGYAAQLYGSPTRTIKNLCTRQISQNPYPIRILPS